MAVITPTEVFDFMGTQDDVRANQTAMITALIDREVEEFKRITGAVLEKEDFADILFHNGRNCDIFDEHLYLTGKYRDIFSITKIEELGTEISEATDYSQIGSYSFDPVQGIIEMIGRRWSTAQLAIKISGSLGLVDTTDPWPAKKDVKQILIEMVAAKSNLWEINIQTEDAGNITQIKNTINPDTKKSIMAYKKRYSI